MDRPVGANVYKMDGEKDQLYTTQRKGREKGKVIKKAHGYTHRE